MAESSHLPRSRLNEIARKKLGALGMPAIPSDDGEFLGGELGLAGAVTNPLSGRPIERGRYVVEGHDHLRFLEPPLLASLPPVLFYDLDRTGPLAGRIQAALDRRAEAAQVLAGKVKALGLPAELDAERGLAVGRVELAATGTVILEGDETGLFAVRLLPKSSSRGPVDLGREPLDLRELDHKVDVELHLAQLAEAALKAPLPRPPGPPGLVPGSPPATPGPAAAAAPPPPGALTLGLLQEKLGAEALVGPGLAIARDLTVEGKRVRFTARLESGRTFHGKLTAATGTLFDERFDLDRFPGIDVFVAGLVAAAPPAYTFSSGGIAVPPAVRAIAAGTAPSLPPGAILPVAGETWVMNILVEREDEREVRFAATDVDGKPVGGTRTLPRAEFRATFAAAGPAYRLLARVQEVTAADVTYVQLDPDRRPVGKPRASALAGFLSRFVPEAAAY